MSRDCLMAAIDLKDAHYLISIHPDHRKFLRFTFLGQLYEFMSMPFGLNTAPYIFTKLMRVVIAHLRQKGYQSVVYLDDILLFGDSYVNCLENVNASLLVLEKLDFIINKEKSRRSPSKTCKFLGFILDSHTMKLALPQDKRMEIFKKYWKISVHTRM